jgi:hypothetical protein
MSQHLYRQQEPVGSTASNDRGGGNAGADQNAEEMVDAEFEVKA